MSPIGKVVLVITVLSVFCLLRPGAPLNATETREFMDRSCTEVFSVISGSDATESRRQQELLIDKWVRWKGSFESKSETLWGYDVTLRCPSQGAGGTISVSFDSKWKANLDRLTKGQQLEYVARVSGFNDTNKIELSEGEVVSASMPSAQTLSPQPSGITQPPAPGRADFSVPSAQRQMSSSAPTPSGDKQCSESEVKCFIRSYLDSLERGSEAALLGCYETRVDYYSAGIVGLDFIQKDKQNFLKKWRKLKYDVLEPVEVVYDQVPGTLTVRFVYQFSADSGKEVARGKAENIWKIKKIDGKLKIVGEKQKILSRERI